MASLRGNISKFFAWIMVSIVIVSLAGFGIQDVILGSMGQNIASIGKEKITIDEFLKSVENEILDFSQRNNVTLSIDDAKKYGLVNKALNDLLAKKIFDNLIKNEEISRENNSVVEYIKTVESFKNLNGDFDVEKYKRYVAATGVNIKEFESALKDDLVRELVLNVFQAPSKIDTVMIEKSIEHYFQSRNVSFVELNLNTFRNVAKKPSEIDVSEYFEKRKDQFKSPNIKKFKLASINFSDIVNEQIVENRLIKEYYDENIASFKKEETRLIDTLSFSNEGDKSKKRIQAIKENPKLFDEEIASRGLKIEDVTLGSISKSISKENTDLKKLFDKKTIGVHGPFETDLGLAIYRIRQINAESQITFSDAKSEIRTLLASEVAKDEIFKLLEDLNNEVAAGQTLEDLAPKFSLSLEILEIANNELPERFKNDPNAKELFDNVSDQVTEFELLGDNSLLAVKLDNELKSRALTLVEASKDIKELLLKENLLIGAKAYFDKKLKPGNENFLNQLFEMNSDEEVFVEVKNRKLFRFNPDSQVAKGDMERIFSIKQKEFILFYTNSKLFLAFVENITPNDIDKELKRTLFNQREQFFKQSLRQNFINNYLNFIKQDTDIKVNEGLIESTLLNLRRTG